MFTEDCQTHKSSCPNSRQIDRACRMYSAGCSAEDMHDSFASELDDEGLGLLWHSAKTAYVIDERFPFPRQEPKTKR